MRKPQNWPRSKIKMHLEDAGWSLRRLSLAHGFSARVGSKALDGPLIPRMELIIAEVIGVEPQVIWPLYYPDGKRAPRSALEKHITPRRRRTNGDAT